MSVFETNHGMARAPGSNGIYGVVWDGTETHVLTRTNDAAEFSDPIPYVSGSTNYSSPFDNIMPWKGMLKVEDTQAGTLVEIPKFWYNITQNGSSLSIQIANYETEGFSVSPAHMDRGDGVGERDVVYVGRYHCGATAYKSATGQLPKVSITRDTARTAIHNLGSTIWQSDFAMRFTIWLLYLVEFANFDSQAMIGMGIGNNSSIENNGASDSIPYHTGTPYTSRSTWGVGVQYRWIEGLWDNCYDWTDGIYINTSSPSGTYIILNPSQFSDSSNGVYSYPYKHYSNVTSLGISNDPFIQFYPATGTLNNGYSVTSDSWYGSGNTVLFGAPGFRKTSPITDGAYYGIFNLLAFSISTTGSNFGTRLMKLP